MAKATHQAMTTMLDLGDHEVLPQSPHYPVELEHDLTAQDGSTLHFRPIRPDDASGLVAFHDQLSRQSIYRRYFFMHTELSSSEVERFTCVDYVSRLAIVVIHDDHIVAVGRYNQTPGTSEAEVAFVVADKYQLHGIGTLLLDQLSEAAWGRGIDTFTALILVENRVMLDVFHDSGFPIDTDLEDGTLLIRFSIRPCKESKKARSIRKIGRSTPK